MSHDEGAPVSSGIVDNTAGLNPANRLIELVRSGRSFSGNEKNCVFLNTKKEQFADVSAVSGLAIPDDARAIGQVDWDADGDLDLWVTNRNAPQLRFFQNQLNRQGTQNHRSVSFNLVGTKSNRDAIGARVEIDLANGTIVRTVRAGDGYLSQSSKRLVIGVGNANQISLRIQWPSGLEQVFENLVVDRVYQVVEGNEAITAIPPRPAQNFAASPLEEGKLLPVIKLPKESEALSVSTIVRPYLPRLSYIAYGSGERKDLIDKKGKPILLVLFASWCPACQLELNELSKLHAKLSERGVQVAAFCVDDLTSDATKDSQFDIKKLPFEVAKPDPSTIAKLQLVNDHLFMFKRDFPVPMSFLIDKDYRLTSIYRGRMVVSRLMADTESLRQTGRDLRLESVPFAGKWIGEPTSLPMTLLILDLIRDGYLDDASELVQRIQRLFRKPAILQLVVRLGVNHYKAGSLEKAEQHFRMARKIDSKTIGPELELGKHFESIKEYEKARDSYQRALQISPKNIAAMNNLAWLLATCQEKSIRNGSLAVRLSTQANRMTQSRYPQLLDTLAAALAESGEFESAANICERAIQIANANSQFNLAGQMKARKAAYESKQ